MSRGLLGGEMVNNVSMAVWCIGRTAVTNSQMEAHFNYWRLAGERTSSNKKASNDFVEVGIMLKVPQSVDKVKIYFPAKIERKSISDCSHYFKDPQISQGIFNEPLDVTDRDVSSIRCVELTNAISSTPVCRVHKFLENGSQIDASELELSDQNDGTILTISGSAISDYYHKGEDPAIPLYFRLRIIVPSPNPFVKSINTAERFFQSGFDQIEYVDFRLNEARTLPKNIEIMMKKERSVGGMVELNMVAFLTAIPIKSQVSMSSNQPRKFRILEDRIWQNYISGGIPSGMLVYHWKDERDIEIPYFSAFVRIQTRRTGSRILVNYLVIAFLFAILGNLTAAGLQSMITYLWAIRSQGEAQGSPGGQEDAARSSYPPSKPPAGVSGGAVDARP